MRFAAIYRPFGDMRRRRREPRDAAGGGPDAWSPGAEGLAGRGDFGPRLSLPGGPRFPPPECGLENEGPLPLARPILAPNLAAGRGSGVF